MVLLFLWFIHYYFFRCVKCWEMSHRLTPLETEVLWSSRREKGSFPFLLSLCPKGRVKLSSCLCHPVPLLPPAMSWDAPCWDEVTCSCLGPGLDLTKTLWDNDLPPTDLAVFDYLSLEEEASRSSYQSPAPLHCPCGLVAFALLCTPWKPNDWNLVIREGMELVCNLFQSHDISSLIFNGHAYT